MSTTSIASIVTQLHPESIESGASAITTSVSINLIRKVYLAGNPALLQPLRAIIAQGNGFVDLADNAEDETDFIVHLTPQQEYEICDSTGLALAQMPLVNVQDEDAASFIARLLTHLVKYEIVLQLDNKDIDSPIFNQFSIELAGWLAEYEIGDPPPIKPNPFSVISSPTLKEGETAFLRIVNHSNKGLNVVVMNLDSGWSIEQIYPQNTPFLYFEPSQERLLPLQGTIPSGSTEAIDIIKVFATMTATDFRWLELPPINQLPKAEAGAQQTTDLQASAMQQGTLFEQSRIMHRAIIDESLSTEWAVKQVHIRVQRT